ncbi:MAG: tRNA uridine-5-carboxymethylaminomethyl(34) synthesis GTPase MnmE [Desulfuromonas sp.]|nr:MAG: tRNA uridine-5-carboxymethylaminomethyl(34) synthesis GTPase MnmE [Desulfuromonas sp.]
MKSGFSEETIVAPATAVGEGGIGIIRLSGTSAELTLQRFFRPSRSVDVFESHQLYHGHLLDSSGSLLDEVLAVVMRAPRSYTGEEIVEVHCHGGPVIIRQIVDLFIDAGLRLARPGEFTLRAFLNGRLDLSRAEAVIDLIRSRSESASQLAVRQLDGALSRIIYDLRERLVENLSLIEAHIDFPDEDISPPALANLCANVKKARDEIDPLLASFDSGRVLREGLNVLILGRPNVGKSSLLNALLGESRAIVTDIPGTTRDTVEESFVISGLPIRLIDTAGVHATSDPIEAEGVRRATEKVKTADLVLLVVDGSQEASPDDFFAFDLVEKDRALLVVNKSDCPAVLDRSRFSGLAATPVSAKNGAGLDLLKDKIASLFSAGGEVSESTMISDRRHREALLRSREALNRFLASVQSAQEPEFLALDLREALHALGEITGETTPDEILDRIFSRFCIGK